MKDFFAQQDEARGQSRRLLMLFAGAVLLYVALLNLPFMIMLVDINTAHPQQMAAQFFRYSGLFLLLSMIVFLLIGAGTLSKTRELRQGGWVVAVTLDGTEIDRAAKDPEERRVLNVVEEMAIASGISVPPVYVLEQHGINAFAAGHGTRDAVIGITRGAVQSLARRELQGLLAHEFAQILNGDMRLNMRLLGVLHGLLAIGLFGRFLMEPGNDKFGREQKAGPFWIIGAVIWCSGYLGFYLGGLIRASVSRERKFLADALAVQLTRNPRGIGDALRKIGGFPIGSFVDHAEAREMGQIFAADPVTHRLVRSEATHPTLAERIRRVDPSRGARFIDVELPEDLRVNPAYLERRPGLGATAAADQPAPSAAGSTSLTAAAAAGGHVAASPDGVREADGYDDDLETTAKEPDELAEARRLLEEIPDDVLAGARDTEGAQSIVYALLLRTSEPAIHSRQLAALQAELAPSCIDELEAMLGVVPELHPRLRLPIMELVTATLRKLDASTYRAFKRCVVQLIEADSVVDLSEWALYRMLVHHLEDPPTPSEDGRSLRALSPDCARLLSAVALASTEDAQAAQAAFQNAWAALGLPPRALVTDSLTVIPKLDRALKRANRLHVLRKPRLVKACRDALGDPDDPEGIELVRIIADGLDVPMPPLASRTRVN